MSTKSRKKLVLNVGFQNPPYDAVPSTPPKLPSAESSTADRPMSRTLIISEFSVPLCCVKRTLRMSVTLQVVRSTQYCKRPGEAKSDSQTHKIAAHSARFRMFIIIIIIFLCFFLIFHQKSGFTPWRRRIAKLDWPPVRGVFQIPSAKYRSVNFPRDSVRNLTHATEIGQQLLQKNQMHAGIIKALRQEVSLLFLLSSFRLFGTQTDLVTERGQSARDRHAEEENCGSRSGAAVRVEGSAAERDRMRKREEEKSLMHAHVPLSCT